jgi:hypothetical protein
MDIGIWMSGAVFSHKLQARRERNPEEAWNLSKWPNGLSDPGQHRMFVAVDGFWRGYFVLSKDGLFNPKDPKTPYTLLFDTRTWTPIDRIPVQRFRGFTYNVPLNPGPPQQASPEHRPNQQV